MTLDEYYNRQFRYDLTCFFDAIPENSKHHMFFSESFTIQYSNLARNSSYMRQIPVEKIAFFSYSLFITVLADQVCYSHFKEYYEPFRVLTQYPKFIGDCPGGCRYNLHSSGIFDAVNNERSYLYWRHHRTRNRNYIEVEKIDFDDDGFKMTAELMKKEVFDFFPKYIPALDVEAFWTCCLREMPLCFVRESII